VLGLKFAGNGFLTGNGFLIFSLPVNLSHLTLSGKYGVDAALAM
jgi:hypothetical protein